MTPEQALKHLEWLSQVAKDTAQNPYAQDLLKKGSWWRNAWEQTERIKGRMKGIENMPETEETTNDCK